MRRYKETSNSAWTKMKFDSAGVVVNKIDILAKQIQPPNVKKRQKRTRIS
jgi:hypothetical protein